MSHLVCVSPFCRIELSGCYEVMEAQLWAQHIRAAFGDEDYKGSRALNVITCCSGTAAPILAMKAFRHPTISPNQTPLLQRPRRVLTLGGWSLCSGIHKQHMKCCDKPLLLGIFMAALAQLPLLCMSQAMQLPYVEILSMDPKEPALKFVAQNGLKAKHHVKMVQDVNDGKPHCEYHNRRGCLDDVLAGEKVIDLYLTGPPCQPFSQQRSLRYQTRWAGARTDTRINTNRFHTQPHKFSLS